MGKTGCAQHLNKVTKSAHYIGALLAMIRVCRANTQVIDIPSTCFTATPHKFPTVKFLKGHSTPSVNISGF